MPLLIKGFSDEKIDTGEVQIGYSVGPDNGPDLLMLHGVTSRRDGFLRVIDSLTPNYRVITMDQRGHGFSGHTPGQYDRMDHARDIKFVMENVCRGPVTVWGHSMGGGNAVGMAQEPSENFAALVLEDAAVFPRVRPRTAGSATLSIFEAQLKLIDEGLSIDELATKLNELTPGQPEYFGKWKAECLLQLDSEILRSIVDGTTRGVDDPAATLANIDRPILLVQADPEAGGILPGDYLASIVPDRDDFTVVKLPGVGHNINREHPDKMLEVVLPWLETHKS